MFWGLSFGPLHADCLPHFSQVCWSASGFAHILYCTLLSASFAAVGLHALLHLYSVLQFLGLLELHSAWLTVFVGAFRWRCLAGLLALAKSLSSALLTPYVPLLHCVVGT